MADTPTSHWSSAGSRPSTQRDIETLRELIAEDAVQTMVGDNVVSGEFKGLDHILGMYGTLAELTNGTYSVTIEETFTDGNGTVVVVHRQTAERNGKRLDNRQALVFKIEGGKVVSLTDSSDDPGDRRPRSTAGEAGSPSVSSRAIEIACFGHCRTASSHFSRRSSGGFSCRT